MECLNDVGAEDVADEDEDEKLADHLQNTTIESCEDDEIQIIFQLYKKFKKHIIYISKIQPISNFFT